MLKNRFCFIFNKNSNFKKNIFKYYDQKILNQAFPQPLISAGRSSKTGQQGEVQMSLVHRPISSVFKAT